MNSLLFDIQLGVSGDILLASLLDSGLSLGDLKSELMKLNLDQWGITVQQDIKNHLAGKSITVTTGEQKAERNITDIAAIIEGSTLSPTVKKNSMAIFNRLASAEASVHGTTPDAVHFHEVGALDSIIDTVGFCIAMELLDVKKILFTEFCMGRGTVNSRHGEIAIPVPAVVELTKGYRSRLTDKLGELITPTGAAILTALGQQIESTISYTVLRYGIGFGTRPYPFPSYTRAFFIELTEPAEEIFQLECNIDDMNPQLYPYIIERLLEGGALDAYIIPVVMKKGRSGVLLIVISTLERVDWVKECIYRETTTLGIRYMPVVREKLDRSSETITLFNQKIGVKVGYHQNRVINVHPEFEDCKKAAQRSGHPLEEIMRLAREAYLSKTYKTFSSSEENI